MEIGKKGHKFEVVFNQDVNFKKRDIILMSPQYSNAKVEVISTPKTHYNRWYWRLLNTFLFGFFFNVKYTYTVKLLEDVRQPG